jgi:hypothetical protein
MFGALIKRKGGPATDLATREAEHPFAEMTCLRQLVTRALAAPFTLHRKVGHARSDSCSL